MIPIKKTRYPLSIFALFNRQTLDYWVDNQAFVGFLTPSVFCIKKAASGGKPLFLVKGLIPFKQQHNQNRLS
jgi:hypothetical protein